MFVDVNCIDCVFVFQNSENEDLDPHERRKLKKLKAVSDSEEDEEEDDEERMREELHVSWLIKNRNVFDLNR